MTQPDREPESPAHTVGAREHERRLGLRARRRRRAMRRLDVAIGVLVAVVAILVAPGIALAAIIAAVVLIVAGVWLLAERRRRAPRGLPRRRGRASRRRPAR